MHAKQSVRGPMGAALLGGVPLGGLPGMMGMAPEPPKVDPNACAVSTNFMIQFPDGDNMQLTPPPVGTEDGNVDRLFAEIDRVVSEVKDMVRLKFKQRSDSQNSV